MNTVKTVISESPATTHNIAKLLASESPPFKIICLFGDLGSGKTEFAKGYAKACGIEEKKIKSPTFTYFRQYDLNTGPKAETQSGTLYHFDFYRIENVDDLIIHEVEEILSRKNITAIIEWPERILEFLPKNRVELYLEYLGENRRKITIRNAILPGS